MQALRERAQARACLDRGECTHCDHRRVRVHTRASTPLATSPLIKVNEPWFAWRRCTPVHTHAGLPSSWARLLLHIRPASTCVGHRRRRGRSPCACSTLGNYPSRSSRPVRAKLARQLASGCAGVVAGADPKCAPACVAGRSRRLGLAPMLAPSSCSTRWTGSMAVRAPFPRKRRPIAPRHAAPAAVILRPAVACLPGRISAPEKKCRYRTRHTQAPKRRKSGLRFFCSRRRRPPCSWCAGEPVWPVVVTIRSLRARARVIWARLARWGAAAAAGAPSRRCAARHSHSTRPQASRPRDFNFLKVEFWRKSAAAVERVRAGYS